MITSLRQMADTVRSSGRSHTIAVAWAQDPNTVGSLHRAVSEGFAEAILIGRREQIIRTSLETGADPERFTIIEAGNEKTAAELAVSMTASGETCLLYTSPSPRD